jgi:glycerol-3-phosphate acyltransferase PlsX
MRIALDAMGGDRAPEVPVRGALEAIGHLPDDVQIVLVGDPAAIRAHLGPEAGHPRIEILPASQVIEMGEPPVPAVRKKTDSSLVVGLKAHAAGAVDAFVTGGSTGAAMAASLFFLKPLPGVDRPAIGAVFPGEAPTLVLDVGANVDCRPHHLLQFAHLGHIYAQDILGRPSPRIGLLNIGEEPGKGNELAVEAYELLSRSGLRFVGNVEGRDILRDCCDVVVTDGFVGNVVLKFYEAAADFILQTLRPILDVGRPEAGRLVKFLDYTTYGGAPLLGVNGVVVITHGDTPPRAIANAIDVAVQAVERRTVDHLRRQLATPGLSKEARAP